MTMLCTSSQFAHRNSVMGLSTHALPRVVAFDQVASVGDGPFKFPDDHNRVLVEQEVHWANTFPCPVHILPIMRRRSRLLRTTTTVIAKVYERATVLVGEDRQQQVRADDPDPTLVPDSVWGGGDHHFIVQADGGLVSTSTPRQSIWTSEQETTHMLPFQTVPVGRSISVRFRALLRIERWAVANAEADIVDVTVRGNTIALLAFPTPEETP